MSRIALIDDEDLVRESVCRLLQLRGHSVDSYESAEHFQSAFNPDTVDCLVVDFRLPGMNGCELLRSLRSMSVQTPAVLLSGNVDDTIEAMVEGLDRIITLAKPCLSDELYSAVDKSIADGD